MFKFITWHKWTHGHFGRNAMSIMFLSFTELRSFLFAFLQPFFPVLSKSKTLLPYRSLKILLSKLKIEAASKLRTQINVNKVLEICKKFVKKKSLVFRSTYLKMWKNYSKINWPLAGRSSVSHAKTYKCALSSLQARMCKKMKWRQPSSSNSVALNLYSKSIIRLASKASFFSSSL